MISWLPPRHALGEYKLTCPTFNSVLFSPAGFELCRTLMVPSGWSLSWDGLVSSSSCDALHDALLCCSFVVLFCVLLRGALSCRSFVVLCRAAPSWWLYRDSRLGNYSVVVTGCYYSRLLWKREFGFHSVHICRWRRVSIPWFLAARCSTLRR